MVSTRTSQLTQTLSTLLREMEALAARARESMAEVAPDRKFDLSNPRGWLDVQEAIYLVEPSERMSEAISCRLRGLCAAWWYRYYHLRYITATRPVWNT